VAHDQLAAECSTNSTMARDVRCIVVPICTNDRKQLAGHERRCLEESAAVSASVDRCAPSIG